ncbi:helix-turn-helix transcriptional regulator [Streptosporangium sp. NBC_01495]|uniref:helix-turn-helix domain-containing protein n=1 Tax=Streptosporangium sp. NBC_01495 TaxID=2903899 RepID=UPI002E35E7CB|nr:helix-turn-helix transcriptional regulator [Streptosporangium sp. NBC_01495]
MIARRRPKINRHAVRALRLSQGFSQVKLASRAGLDNSYVSRIESGQRLHPAPDVTLRLAEALGVPMAALVADVEALAH